MSTAEREVDKPGTPNRPYIGGQAVLEGVMMRSPHSFAIVVRRRDRSLHVRERKMPKDTSGPRGIPFLRGVMGLVDSLRLGSDALRFSAEQMEKDLDAEEREQAKKAKTSIATKTLGVMSQLVTALGLSLFVLNTADQIPEVETKKKGGAGMGVTLLIMVLFMWALPQGSAALFNRFLHLNLEVQSPQFQAITGVFKLIIVIGYLLLIRRMSDIRRVFQYHGAEHKTISTYEANLPLTVENARAQTTLHPRCGTTFLVMVALMSVLVFTGVGAFMPRIHTGKELLDNVLFFLVKLPFIPVIAAFTFELQRVFARYCTTGPLRMLLVPGFLVQRITTIEPDDDQLEVALGSLRATLFREEGVAGEQAGDVRFANYNALLNAEKLRTA